MINKMQKNDDFSKNIKNISNFQNGVKKVWDFIMQDRSKALLTFKVFYRKVNHEGYNCELNEH